MQQRTKVSVDSVGTIHAADMCAQRIIQRKCASNRRYVAASVAVTQLVFTATQFSHPAALHMTLHAKSNETFRLDGVDMEEATQTRHCTCNVWQKLIHCSQQQLQRQHYQQSKAATSSTSHDNANAAAEIFEGSTPQQLVSALQGRRLLAAGRKGKNLWLTLEGQGPMPTMHFGEKRTAVIVLLVFCKDSSSSSASAVCTAHLSGNRLARCADFSCCWAVSLQACICAPLKCAAA